MAKCLGEIEAEIRREPERAAWIYAENGPQLLEIAKEQAAQISKMREEIFLLGREKRALMDRQNLPTLPTHEKKCTPEEDGATQSACRSGGASLSRAVN